jgi:hypothetical protein
MNRTAPDSVPALPPAIAALLDAYRDAVSNRWRAFDDSDVDAARAALEAEIATLAQRAIDANRYEDAILWALGAEGEFAPQPPTHGRYWWRRELRERAGELRAARTPTGGTPT